MEDGALGSASDSERKQTVVQVGWDVLALCMVFVECALRWLAGPASALVPDMPAERSCIRLQADVGFLNPRPQKC